jgi:hypothetical protein
VCEPYLTVNRDQWSEVFFIKTVHYFILMGVCLPNARPLHLSPSMYDTPYVEVELESWARLTTSIKLSLHPPRRSSINWQHTLVTSYLLRPYSIYLSHSAVVPPAPYSIYLSHYFFNQSALQLHRNMGSAPVDVWYGIVLSVAPEDYSALAMVSQTMRWLVLPLQWKHWIMNKEACRAMEDYYNSYPDKLCPMQFVESLTCITIQEDRSCVPPHVPFARMPKITQVKLKTPVDEVELLSNCHQLHQRMTIEPSRLLEQIRELQITHLTLPCMSRLVMENAPALPMSLKELDLDFNPSHKAIAIGTFAYFTKWLMKEENREISERINVKWHGELPQLYRSGAIFKNLRRCLKHVIIDAQHIVGMPTYHEYVLMFKQTQLPPPWNKHFVLPNVESITLRNFRVNHNELFSVIRTSLGHVQNVTLEDCVGYNAQRGQPWPS